MKIKNHSKPKDLNKERLNKFNQRKSIWNKR